MLRRLSHLAIALMLLLSGATIPQKQQTTTASLLPEVRLRKLHLVRPDLIQYPIMYEVVC